MMIVHTNPPKRVYLDVCALCRPFDDQRHMRIRLETSAVELILAHVQSSDYQLIVSPVHDIEIGAISNKEERDQLLLLLQRFGVRPEYDLGKTRTRAEELTAQGMGAADAAHVAFAEQAEVEFVTVDDRLLRRCRRLGVTIWCGTPQAYCEKENLQ